MDPSTIRTLIDYNEWATARLLTAAAPLDEAELRRARPGAGHGSIWGQLHHIALSQIGLHLACLGKVDSPMRARQVIAESGRFDLETPGGLWRAFEISHADLRELRDALTPEMLARPLSSEPRFHGVSLGDLVLQLLPTPPIIAGRRRCCCRRSIDRQETWTTSSSRSSETSRADTPAIDPRLISRT
jgi:DinB family protein